MHESALRDFAITNFGANGCAYFELPEEATAAAVQLKALLLDHGDELREWLGKDVLKPSRPPRGRRFAGSSSSSCRQSHVDLGYLQPAVVEKSSVWNLLLELSCAVPSPWCCARIHADLFARQLCDTPTLESIAALLRCHYSDPQAIRADMPIETIFARNQFLALMPLLGISTVRFIRGTHSVKKLGDTTTSATAITILCCQDTS
jgi:hypothetical protein